MTPEFRQFQRCGIDVDNLGIIMNNPEFSGIPGRIYLYKFPIFRSSLKIGLKLSEIYGIEVPRGEKRWVCRTGLGLMESDDIEEIEFSIFTRNAISNPLASVRNLYNMFARAMFATQRLREKILEIGSRNQLGAMCDALRNGNIQGGTLYVSDGIRQEGGSPPLDYETIVDHANRRHNYFSSVEALWK